MASRRARRSSTAAGTSSGQADAPATWQPGSRSVPELPPGRGNSGHARHASGELDECRPHVRGSSDVQALAVATTSARLGRPRSARILECTTAAPGTIAAQRDRVRLARPSSPHHGRRVLRATGGIASLSPSRRVARRTRSATVRHLADGGRPRRLLRAPTTPPGSPARTTRTPTPCRTVARCGCSRTPSSAPTTSSATTASPTTPPSSRPATASSCCRRRAGRDVVDRVVGRVRARAVVLAARRRGRRRRPPVAVPRRGPQPQRQRGGHRRRAGRHVAGAVPPARPRAGRPRAGRRRVERAVRLLDRLRRRLDLPLRALLQAVRPGDRGRVRPVVLAVRLRGPGARGQLDRPPQYWSGAGWTARRSARQPVLTGEHSMPVSVERFGDVYVAASDENDWFGTDVVDPHGAGSRRVRGPRCCATRRRPAAASGATTTAPSSSPAWRTARSSSPTRTTPGTCATTPSPTPRCTASVCGAAQRPRRAGAPTAAGADRGRRHRRGRSGRDRARRAGPGRRGSRRQRSPSSTARSSRRRRSTRTARWSDHVLRALRIAGLGLAGDRRPRRDDRVRDDRPARRAAPSPPRPRPAATRRAATARPRSRLPRSRDRRRPLGDRSTRGLTPPRRRCGRRRRRRRRRSGAPGCRLRRSTGPLMLTAASTRAVGADDRRADRRHAGLALLDALDPAVRRRARRTARARPSRRAAGAARPRGRSSAARATTAATRRSAGRRPRARTAARSRRSRRAARSSAGRASSASGKPSAAARPRPTRPSPRRKRPSRVAPHEAVLLEGDGQAVGRGPGQARSPPAARPARPGRSRSSARSTATALSRRRRSIRCPLDRNTISECETDR